MGFKIELDFDFDFDFDFDLNVNELTIGGDTDLGEVLEKALTGEVLFLKETATETANTTNDSSIVNQLAFKALPFAFVIYVFLRFLSCKRADGAFLRQQ